jgi:hypothetical protein
MTTIETEEGELIAGLAHLDRLAVSGALTTFPRRERLSAAIAVMLAAAACAVCAVVIAYGVWG